MQYNQQAFDNTDNTTQFKQAKQDFPSSPVVKSLPANAGDAGSLLQKIPCAVVQVTPRDTTTEPASLELIPGNRRSCGDEEPEHRNQRKPCAAMKTQHR